MVLAALSQNVKRRGKVEATHCALPFSHPPLPTLPAPPTPLSRMFEAQFLLYNAQSTKKAGSRVTVAVFNFFLLVNEGFDDSFLRVVLGVLVRLVAAVGVAGGGDSGVLVLLLLLLVAIVRVGAGGGGVGGGGLKGGVESDRDEDQVGEEGEANGDDRAEEGEGDPAVLADGEDNISVAVVGLAVGDGDGADDAGSAAEGGGGDAAVDEHPREEDNGEVLGVGRGEGGERDGAEHQEVKQEVNESEVDRRAPEEEDGAEDVDGREDGELANVAGDVLLKVGRVSLEVGHEGGEDDGGGDHVDDGHTPRGKLSALLNSLDVGHDGFLG